ncbi:hypothetical protein QBC39DRAFT_387134 [Podospora conica]|nr:hypothetical protein QBC39DRAFT_387134 [Schizothecium conicum]
MISRVSRAPPLLPTYAKSAMGEPDAHTGPPQLHRQGGLRYRPRSGARDRIRNSLQSALGWTRLGPRPAGEGLTYEHRWTAGDERRPRVPTDAHRPVVVPMAGRCRLTAACHDPHLRDVYAAVDGGGLVPSDRSTTQASRPPPLSGIWNLDEGGGRCVPTHEIQILFGPGTSTHPLPLPSLPAPRLNRSPLRRVLQVATEDRTNTAGRLATPTRLAGPPKAQHVYKAA